MAAPKGNKNAEIWTEEEATNFMDDSLALVRDKKHDFIGEVARDMKQYRQLYVYLIDRYPLLQPIYDIIIQECETNCFSHGKKGDIVPSLAIMNLKSNHKWTDRSEIEHNVKSEQPLFGKE